MCGGITSRMWRGVHNQAQLLSHNERTGFSLATEWAEQYRWLGRLSIRCVVDSYMDVSVAPTDFTVTTKYFSTNIEKEYVG